MTKGHTLLSHVRALWHLTHVLFKHHFTKTVKNNTRNTRKMWSDRIYDCRIVEIWYVIRFIKLLYRWVCRRPIEMCVNFNTCRRFNRMSVNLYVWPFHGTLTSEFFNDLFLRQFEILNLLADNTLMHDLLAFGSCQFGIASELSPLMAIAGGRFTKILSLTYL